MFPIYLKDQDPFPPPPEPTYFLLARHGVYLVKRSPLYDAVTKCEEELPTLAAQCPQLRLKIPQFPQSMFEAVVGFFVEVFQRYQTEAIVMLFYAPARGFRVLVPPQQVRRWAMGADSLSTDHVQYQHLPRPQGYLQLGSIHSHGALPATHSCLDVLDE